MRCLLATCSLSAFLLATSPTLAQISVDVSVGGVNAGVEVGAGDPQASAPASGVGGGGTGGADANADTTAATPSPQDMALDAVRAERALPLEQIIARAGEVTSGAVIDTRLFTLRGFLLYELKVLEENGDVVDLYFYARSGERVRTP